MVKRSDNSTPVIVLASGGTGGHIFPAEALASELMSRGIRPVLISDKRYKHYTSSLPGLEVHTIRASTLGNGLVKRIKSAANIIIGYFQARRWLKKLKPKVVVGFGGYPSFPTMFAAVRNGYTTMLHEQNSLVGQSNQVLANKVNKIATSFPRVSGMAEQNLSKVEYTGNPVRPSIKLVRAMGYPALQEDGLLRLLVTGGSQGAKIFGEVIPAALELLPQNLRRRIRIDQQCKADDISRVREIYERIGVSADLAAFFTDIPSRLSSCHLVIARSGASTIAELAVAGRPAIMVPLPTAKDDHQTVNANIIEEQGGGWVIPQDSFTPAGLAARLEEFLTLPSLLTEAAANMKLAGQEEADKKLADAVLVLAGILPQPAPLDAEPLPEKFAA